MNNFKKVMTIIAVGIMLSGLAGCNQKTNTVITNNSKDVSKIVASPKASSTISEADDKVDLSKLNFTLPADWSKRGNENEIFFDDKNKQTVGGISLIGYYGEYSNYLPNHSKILNTEDIDTGLGKGKLFTLESDNPAAANNNQVWNEIHAIIPINQSNLAYDIWVKGTKDNLIKIIDSFQLKN